MHLRLGLVVGTVTACSGASAPRGYGWPCDVDEEACPGHLECVEKVMIGGTREYEPEFVCTLACSEDDVCPYGGPCEDDGFCAHVFTVLPQ